MKKKGNKRDVWTPIFMAFSCGVFLAMFFGCVFRLENIHTLADAQYVYAGMACTAFGVLFFGLFTLLGATALEVSYE